MASGRPVATELEKRFVSVIGAATSNGFEVGGPGSDSAPEKILDSMDVCLSLLDTSRCGCWPDNKEFSGAPSIWH